MKVLRQIWNRKFLIPLILAAVCLTLSFFELTSHNQRMMRLVEVEKILHRKQRDIENIALRELEQEKMGSLSPKDVDRDMVVFNY